MKRALAIAVAVAVGWAAGATAGPAPENRDDLTLRISQYQPDGGNKWKVRLSFEIADPECDLPEPPPTAFCAPPAPRTITTYGPTRAAAAERAMRVFVEQNL